MSQTPNLDAARASLQQAIDQANAIVKPIIDAMREAGMPTPAPEPAAPAVDDDLLRDLAHALWPEIVARTSEAQEAVTDLLASAPMRRLRAAWTAETGRERDDLALRLEGVEAHRERLLEDARTRDEGQLVEVARLRAAQQLPDVGPVTRDSQGFWVGDVHFGEWVGQEGRARQEAARYLAVAAFLDAEAAVTSSDDEATWPLQRVLGKDLFDVGLTSVGPDDLDNGQLAERLVALGWTRARGGQEAGQ